MMNGLEALIFDVDGTLADTERDGHRRAFNQAFADAGLDWVWDEALYGELLAVTGGKERIRHFIRTHGPQGTPVDGEGDFVKELHRRKTEHYVQLLETGAIGLRPGVERLLGEVRDAGLRLAIATTTTPENVTTLLRHCAATDLLPWFEVVAAGDVVAAKKPAPDIYTRALEQLGLPPQACVAIEDSDNGLRSALAADLKAVLVTVGSYTEGQDFAGAPLVVDGLGEPDEPVTVLSGDLDGRPYVDLAALAAMHARVYGRPVL